MKLSSNVSITQFVFFKNWENVPTNTKALRGYKWTVSCNKTPIHNPRQNQQKNISLKARSQSFARTLWESKHDLKKKVWDIWQNYNKDMKKNWEEGVNIYT